MMKKVQWFRRLARLGAVITVAVAGSHLQAGPVSVSTLAALGTNDIANNYALGTFLNPQLATSTNGIGVTMTSGGNMGVIQQAPSGGWAGQFPANTMFICGKYSSRPFND